MVLLSGSDLPISAQDPLGWNLAHDNSSKSSEPNGKITGFNYDLTGNRIKLHFTVTHTGKYERQINDINDISNITKVAKPTVFPKVGLRYSAEPDKLFVTKPALSQNELFKQSVTGKKNNKPVLKNTFSWNIDLRSHEANHSGSYYYSLSGETSVKSWNLPIISNSDNVQIVVYLNEKDAAKGINVESIQVPISGGSGSGDSGESGPVDWKIPGGIVFGLMFIGLGLAGAAAGAGKNSGDAGKPAKEDQEPPNIEGLHLWFESDKDVLIPGESVKITAILRGPCDNPTSILSQITLGVSGEAREYLRVEESNFESGLAYKSFQLFFDYKLDSRFYQGDHALSFPQQIVAGAVNAPSDLKLVNHPLEISLEAPPPEIHLNQKTLIMPENSDKHPELKAWVVAVDKGEWEFSVHPVADLEISIDNAKCKSTSSRECEIKVRSAALPDGAGRSITSNLQILAKNKNTGAFAEKEIAVTSAREGLILVSPGPVRIAADGESKSEIEIAAIRVAHGKLVTDFDMLMNLRFSSEITTSSEEAGKAFQTAGVVFNDSDEGSRWKNIQGYQNGSIPSYVYKVKTARLLPGQGKSYYGTGFVSSGGQKLSIPLMLDVELIKGQSRAWEIELERCRFIINKLPAKHRDRLLAMVDKKARFLGSAGLYHLRRDIWAMGQTLWEAEGLSGYESVEKWAGYIENTLNVSQWAGRMAFEILLTYKYKMGIFMAMAAGEVYDLTLSIVQAYNSDKSFDQWLEESFYESIKDLVINMGAAALDPDKFVAKFGNNKKVLAIAYAVQFGYHFIANMTIRDQSVVEAAKNAGFTVAAAAALRFLAGKVAVLAKKKGLKLNNVDDSVDDVAQQGWKKAKKKVGDFDKAVKSGDPKAIKQKMMDIQKDKFALKEINKWPDDVKLKYNQEMGKIYGSVDKRVKKKIIQDLKKQGYDVSNKNIKMTNATNKTNSVKVGSDRDVSVEFSYIDKNGKTIQLEYPKDKLRDVYGREFYRAVGHKNAKGMMPDELMDKYDQYALDSRDAEAYGMKRMNYENGKMENTDFDKVIKKGSTPQKLADADQIGMTASYKGKEWFNRAADAAKSGNRIEAESFKMEGMSQLVKQYKNIYKPRRNLVDYYSAGRSGKNIMADDSNLNKLMGLMDKAVKLEKSPSYVEGLVKKSGFASLNEFADAFGGRISALNSLMK
jgi:ribosomal protein L9